MAKSKRSRRGGRTAHINEAMDMPERPGKCAYLGGYVEDGDTICHFGEEYVCRAPNFVKTGNAC